MYGYFSAREVVDLAGVTYRQLDYWVRTGVVHVTIGTAGGARRRLFSFADVVEVRAVRTFVTSGVRLGTVRKAVERVRSELSSGASMASVRLVTDGKELLRFEPRTESLVKMDGSGQLAFAFDVGGQIGSLIADIQARPRRSRYTLQTRKTA
jgi:DNA-binding transcriptional MerR regulator